MQKKISYDRALSLILEHVPQGPTESVGIMDLTGRILAEDVAAGVDSPSVDASLKDGYALYSDEVASAGPDARVKLTLANFQVAGTNPERSWKKGPQSRSPPGPPCRPGRMRFYPGSSPRKKKALSGAKMTPVRDETFWPGALMSEPARFWLKKVRECTRP